MLKLRVAVLVKRGEHGRTRLSRLTVRVQRAGLATVAIGSFGLAGCSGSWSGEDTTACSGTAGATRGMPAQARAAADRPPLDTARDRHRLRGERGIGHGDTDRHRDQQSRTRDQGGRQPSCDRYHPRRQDRLRRKLRCWHSDADHHRDRQAGTCHQSRICPRRDRDHARRQNCLRGELGQAWHVDTDRNREQETRTCRQNGNLPRRDGYHARRQNRLRGQSRFQHGDTDHHRDRQGRTRHTGGKRPSLARSRSRRLGTARPSTWRTGTRAR